MSENRTGKLCDVPGCARKARSGSAPYCETHYYRIRRGEQNPLRPIQIDCCLECGASNKASGDKYCSKLCGDRHKRNTPPEKQRGRKPPIDMVAADVRIWREVPHFPDYEISNDGRLRRRTDGSNAKAGRLIRPAIGVGGYPHYGITRPDGRREDSSAHRLVALAFLPPPAPEQNCILHHNDNRFDARDINLRWGTPQDNANDAMRNGRVPKGHHHPSSAQPWTRPRGDGHSAAKLSEEQVREILRTPASGKTLGAKFNVHPSLIYRIRKGKTWRHISDGVYGAQLIRGAADFSGPKPKRRRLTSQRRFDLLKRENYRCHLCKGLIYPGQAWDVSHDIPIELGGADDDTNRKAAHRKCHRVQTATIDIPLIAKAKRVEAKHHAGHVSRNPLPCGRASAWKRKMNGTIVFRATGVPRSRT